MNKKILLFCLFLAFGVMGYSQYAYRIKADIFTKTRLPDSTFQVSKGKLCYDVNNKKIIFDFTFPQKEKIVLFDTIMYTFRKDTLFSRDKNFLIPDQSLFHFMLMGKISNYGLDQANFEMIGVDKKKDMIIATWMPPESMKNMISKVLVTTKEKLLYSVTMIDAKGKVLNRQILKNYKLIQGLEIPSEILIATYLDRGNIYQIINMDNIILNETKNNGDYDQKL